MNEMLSDSHHQVQQKQPNFILIGAQKSGTTALYHTLRQHPEIFMSIWKEPNFFMADEGSSSPLHPYDRPMVHDWKLYQDLFSEAQQEAAIGEASVMYMSGYTPERTAIRIKQRLPAARLIAVLRHPAERAYSAYTFFKSRGIELLPTFEEALINEEQRIHQGAVPGLFYRLNGMYFSHLSKFYEHFPAEQIRVYLYEDWNEKPRQMLKEIFRFLGVKEDVSLPIRRRAVTSYIRSQRYEKIVKCITKQSSILSDRFNIRLAHNLLRFNRTRPAPLAGDIRRTLIEYYRDDIVKLQYLIGRDLQHWLR